MAMEKLGVSKEQLLEELRNDYNTEKARLTGLRKEASGHASVVATASEKKLKAIQDKINEIEGR
jgi:cell division protein FtsX